MAKRSTRTCLTDELGELITDSNPLSITIVENRLPFTSSTNGRPIAIVKTATAGTLIHTSIADNRDHVTMWATNTSDADRKLTIEFGGVATADQIHVFCPAKETVIVLDGLPIQEGLTVAAFTDAGASTVNVAGYYRREAV